MRTLWLAIGTGVAAGVAGCSAGLPDEAVGTTSAAIASARADAGAPDAASACGTRFVAAGGDAATSDDCLSSADPCATIAHAIAAACPGDTVAIGPGTFTENVVVDKALTVRGSGDSTVLVPATSAPNPCTDSSLCGGAASNVVSVGAADVTLARFAVDGDNPAITSGVLVGGADVDARNGIIASAAGAFGGFVVRDVTVRNVYFRGIEAANGGSFSIEESRVENLSSDPQSIGIFNSGGGGTISDDVVSGASAGIAANFSTGTTFARNRVTASATGIHTDNAGALAASSPSSSPDVVDDNEVSACTADGFGVFVFVASLGVTVRGNRVSGCTVGLADFGQGAAVETRFEGNRVDARGVAESTGLYVTTSEVGFGSSDVDVLVARNAIDNASVGILFEQQSGFQVAANARCNALRGDTEGIVTQSSGVTIEHNAIAGGDPALDASSLSSTLDAPHNWWGCSGGPGSSRCGTVSGNVDASPVATTPPLCTFLL